MENKRTLLVGEPMGLFVAERTGHLEDVDIFSATTCGAELNVAVGLRRLEHQVSYMTKLGHDPFGKRIVKTMNASGISTDMVMYSETHPTGFMFKSKVLEGDPDIFYFRKGSAASTISPEDVEHLDYPQYDIVHITGITPALSDSAKAATLAVLKQAKAHGAMFSFDPNLRPQLWPSIQCMSDFMNQVAYQADLFLPGIKEAKVIIGLDKPEEIAEHYLAHGTKCIIIKLGAQGAYYATKECSGYVPGFHVEQIIDTVGAGDGFAAGVLSALQEGLSLENAVRRGCAIGAIQLMSKGDNDGLPTRTELDAFMAGKKDWRISG